MNIYDACRFAPSLFTHKVMVTCGGCGKRIEFEATGYLVIQCIS